MEPVRHSQHDYHFAPLDPRDDQALLCALRRLKSFRRPFYSVNDLKNRQPDSTGGAGPIRHPSLHASLRSRP